MVIFRALALSASCDAHELPERSPWQLIGRQLAQRPTAAPARSNCSRSAAALQLAQRPTAAPAHSSCSRSAAARSLGRQLAQLQTAEPARKKS